jgi:hypothetical protein
MTREEIQKHFEDLMDHVASFFTRKNKEEGTKDLKKHSKGVLEEIQHMDDLLKQFPAYGAIAFIGKLQFENSPILRKLEEEVSEELFHQIQKERAVRVAKSAKEAWDYLVSRNLKTACAVLALCYLYENSQQ